MLWVISRGLHGKIISLNWDGPVLTRHRYNTLYMRGNVNIHWKPDEGTFKFSGSYGV